MILRFSDFSKRRFYILPWFYPIEGEPTCLNVSVICLREFGAIITLQRENITLMLSEIVCKDQHLVSAAFVRVMAWWSYQIKYRIAI
jgi:hypothetical protein